MTAFRYEIPISVTLRTPFATRGLVVSRASTDLPLARNGSKELIIPGTLLTGVLRAALERLAGANDRPVKLGGATSKVEDDIGDLLGRRSTRDEREMQEAWRVANTPDRGRLVIRDLIIDTASAAKKLENPNDYPRVKLDAELGSVAEGFLQFIEQPFAIGETVTFSGVVDLRAGGVPVDRARELLEKALKLVPAIGAIKSSGFGRVVRVAVGQATGIAAASVPAPLAGGSAHRVIYRIDRPFLVGGAMVSANLFRGSPIVPGGAIKGTIAQAVRDAGLETPGMVDLLADITFGHAFPRPAAAGHDPWWPLPLSLAQTDDHTQILDCLLQPEETAIAAMGRCGGALRFAPDVKSDGALRRHFGLDWDLPTYDVRTRTKIDGRTGMAAYEDGAGQLFSYAAVEPRGFEWVGRLIVPDKVDPSLLNSLLGLLQIGITGLGKTGAMIKGEIGATLSYPSVAGDLALTLVTPAALNDLDTLRAGSPLQEDYAKYWDKLGYELVEFFAQQRLEGGYLALRYPPRSDACDPYLLTEPGSVFLVRPMKPNASLNDLLMRGLPPTEWIAKRDWQSCPFQRENGYGEVRLNLVDHRALTAGAALPAENDA